MTYSCSDFSDDIVRCLVGANLLEPNRLPDGDIKELANMSMNAIVSLEYKALSARFTSELLGSVETLGGVYETFGARTLINLIYLQQAIADRQLIEVEPEDQRILELIDCLPSAEQWRQHIVICKKTHDVL